MLQLVREYPTRLLQLQGVGTFASVPATVSLAAEGPYAESHGHLAALTLLNGKVEPFLKQSWQGRWLISADAERQYAKLHGVRTAMCPLGSTPSLLAEYLLVGVFEPMFRASGLLVREVEFWMANSHRARASVALETAALYEGELGVDGQVVALKDPFSPREPLPAGGMGCQNRFATQAFKLSVAKDWQQDGSSIKEA